MPIFLTASSPKMHCPALRPGLVLAVLAACFLLPLTGAPGVRAAGREDKARQEDKALSERYKKWVEEVKYILTEEEKNTFQKLTTDEERDSFIEQFWKRRDPDPRTIENEYKEEYYRRIAYANDHFASAIPGWKTDRGRTYIVCGPPDEIESHPAGGTYRREVYEGGGLSESHPYQVWRYRRVPWMDGPVEIEFVDKGSTGNYTMVMDPKEKDAMMNTPAQGMLGGDLLANYDTRDLTYLALDSTQPTDRYYERLLQYAALQQAPSIKFQDLRTRVQSREFYQSFPFQVQCYPLWMTTDRAVVPISLEVENKHLQYVEKYNVFRAQVDIYILVEALDGRVAAEFDDQLSSTYNPDTIDRGRLEKSVYQRVVLVPAGRYKVNIALKDEASGVQSVKEQSLIINSLAPGSLALSSLILARSIVPVRDESTDPDPYLLGDLRVIPNVSGVFRTTERVGVYGQIYNPTPDSRTQEPHLSVRYQLLREGQSVLDVEDAIGKSLRPSGKDHYVFVKGLPLDNLDAGIYQLKVTVTDGVAERSATSATRVELR
jgi:GWxTD domain-containing protein